MMPSFSRSTWIGLAVVMALVSALLLTFFFVSDDDGRTMNVLRDEKGASPAEAPRRVVSADPTPRRDGASSEAAMVPAHESVFVVSGQVFDEDGGCVEGARVRLVPASTSKSEGAALLLAPTVEQRETLSEAVTTAQGRFRLAADHAGRLRLLVDADGYRPFDSQAFVLSRSHPRCEIALQLVREAAVGCRVVDASGRPLSDVAILYSVSSRMDAGTVRRAPRTTVSDDEGRFVLKGLRSHVRGERFGAYVHLEKPGYVTQSVSQLRLIPIDGRGGLLFTLKPAREILVRFLPEDGELTAPLRFVASMQRSNYTQVAETDKAGVARLDTVPGGNDLRLRLLGDAWRVVRGSAPRRPLDGILDSGLGFAFVLPETGNAELSVPIAPAGVLSGRLIDVATRQPVEGVTLAWTRTNHQSVGSAQRCVTEKDGRFHLKGLPFSSCSVFLFSRDWRFVGLDGRPLGAPPSPEDRMRKLFAPVVAAERGAPLPEAAGLPVIVADAVTLRVQLRPSEPSSSVVIGMRKLSTAKGRVLDGAGQPLAGVSVAPKWTALGTWGGVIRATGSDTRWRTTTGEDGVFEVAVMAQAPPLVFRHAGFATKTLPISQVDASGTVDLGEIRLSPLVPVVFRAVYESGEPVPDVELEIMPWRYMGSGDPHDSRTVTTGENGEAHVLLPAGPGHLQWRAPEGVALVTGDVFERRFSVPSEGATFTLTFRRGYFVRGVIVDESGTALADFDVGIRREVDESSGERRTKTYGCMTDGNGFFHVVVPSKGFYRVFAVGRAGLEVSKAGPRIRARILQGDLLEAGGPRGTIRVRLP